MTVPNQFYAYGQNRYTVQLLNGTVCGTDTFADLPLQCKALSWLYAGRMDGAGYSRIFLVSLAQKRAKRVYSPR